MVLEEKTFVAVAAKKGRPIKNQPRTVFQDMRSASFEAEKLSKKFKTDDVRIFEVRSRQIARLKKVI
jgi:hypothetical protein